MIQTTDKKRNIITDKLVVGKTGKSMEEWFKMLDKSGAKKMKHIEIFNLISGTEELGSLGQWNQNLLTTTYEWDRRLKERGQKEDGFEVSSSKTIETNLQDLYGAFSDDSIRSKWLLEKEIKIRKQLKISR